jgi:hypothetical protein
MCILLAAVSLFCTTDSHAQSLNEMAKRAQEQRDAADGKGVRIALESASELRSVPIDRLEVETYVSLRVALARLWHLDPSLFARVRGGSLMARSVTESSRVLEAEPEVMKVLARYKYSPGGLMAMTKSIAEAERLTQGGFDMNELSPTQRENYDFAARNRVWLGVMRGRISRAEAGLTIWR